MSHKRETRLAQLLTKEGLKLFDKIKRSQHKSTNKREDEKMIETKKNELTDFKFKKMKILKLALESL